MKLNRIIFLQKIKLYSNYIAIAGITAKNILHHATQTVETFAHVGWLAVQVKPVFGWQGKHGLKVYQGF